MTPMSGVSNAFSRVRDIDAGSVMVVTDIHGDHEVFALYADEFRRLHTRGQADVLVLAGDMIHALPGQADHSLAVLNEILALKAEFREQIIYLLGNHELAHIYTFPLKKGDHDFTIALEWAFGEQRQAMLTLFDSLPIYVRTAGGVAITHAGAAEPLTDPVNLLRVMNVSHQAMLSRADTWLSRQNKAVLYRAVADSRGMPYDEFVYEFFAVTGEADPRYDDHLRGAAAAQHSNDFRLLREALFNRNEQTYGRDAYPGVLAGFLVALSQGYALQEVLVTGHVPTNGGFALVHPQQLRVASWAHAAPPVSGQYLLFDAATRYRTAGTLSTQLRSVFD